MFGLFYLAWFGLTLALLVFFVRNLIRWFREPEERRKTLARAFAQGLALAALTWPFLLGRAVYEVNCRFRSGLSVEQTVDLHAGGYLIWPDAFDNMKIGSSPWESLAFDRQGVQDLLAGRIAFFERPVFRYLGGTSSDNIVYERLALGDLRQRGCIGTEREQTLLGGVRLPAGTCITLSESRASVAQYRLEGELMGREHYPPNIGRTNFRRKFVDRDTGATLASYRMFSHWSGGIADAGELIYQCPSRAESFNHSPLRELPAFVLRDRYGETVSLETQRNRPAPESALAEQPDAESQSECRAERVEDGAIWYKVSTYGGRDPLAVRLDESGHGVGQVEIVANQPGRPIVLWLQAYDPVVWHVSRTADTRIAAVLVKGFHGQAVLGLDRSIPVYISTNVRGPGTNCYPAEFGEVYRALSGDEPIRETGYGASPDPSFVLVGHEVPDRSQLLYSRDRALEEFTMD